MTKERSLVDAIVNLKVAYFGRRFWEIVILMTRLLVKVILKNLVNLITSFISGKV